MTVTGLLEHSEELGLHTEHKLRPALRLVEQLPEEKQVEWAVPESFQEVCDTVNLILDHANEKYMTERRREVATARTNRDSDTLDDIFTGRRVVDAIHQAGSMGVATESVEIMEGVQARITDGTRIPSKSAPTGLETNLGSGMFALEVNEEVMAIFVPTDVRFAHPSREFGGRLRFSHGMIVEPGENFARDDPNTVVLDPTLKGEPRTRPYTSSQVVLGQPFTERHIIDELTELTAVICQRLNEQQEQSLPEHAVTAAPAKTQ